ncbi:alpha-ketoacid dehydrogenase subunit beta (plasmid) [Roseomonas sp. CCTCC AB2023176]|uniref:alpha-ketoacid dehydrogenase subunit beta n=1 Tax=Roseomonas sp. CCTCC AB2023176 TaxID=3342640 RepID=UPI0035DCB51F
MTELTYAEASRLALQQEMTRDPLVWALGEDLGPEGGVAGQYRGLQQMFGRRRIVDTPISENTIMGAAVGAAVCGTRPVAELRFADFGLCAADELINQAAKIRYMFNGQARVPLVARQAIGFRNGIAAQHSQSTEAFWVHVPGFVVVAPATPADNHALLKAAIRCDDPVVYLEHKELWALLGEVDAEAPPAEIGRAERIVAGPDVTIVTWSRMRHVCEGAVRDLVEGGVRPDLFDLRSLWPWDQEAVLTSVRKTGRLLVVHEAVLTAGLGAEIAQTVTEACWGDLKAAPVRLGGPRAPTPFSKPLEDLHRITEGQVADAARRLLAA